MNMTDKCNECVADKTFCEQCRDNIKYRDVPTRSYFKAYNPVCPLGEQYCVLDPAYIKYTDPDWYKELYGDITPEEAALTDNCGKNIDVYGSCLDYDDEDK